MFRFPLIRPDVPDPADWWGFVQEAHAGARFSNFGPLSRRLERELALTWGFLDSTCVLAASGTAAIAAPLLAFGVTGRVLVPAFTFPATLAAVRMAHLEPVVIDVAEEDWCVSATTLDAALARTGASAAVVVSPFGFRCDFTAHVATARRHGAVLVIDSAACLGVERIHYEAAPHVAEAYSLHATKPFAIGEGGAVFAPRELEPALRRALNFGLPDWHVPPGWGLNGKLSETHAAIGLAAARRFPARLRLRREFVARCIELAGRHRELRFCGRVTESSWQIFPLLFPSPSSSERFIQACHALGLETRRYYAPSLSALPGVEHLGPCPIAESLAARMVCTPVYADYDTACLGEFLAAFSAALTTALPSSCTEPSPA
jgi:dTDP-4-amino-4,6-dideoxygalactose transaminase